ncbi:MAG: MATE family efflux transporter [Chitinophagaceae bacterium]|nr:MATE family efflux transporter [Chitinophagaceae bacterium]
MATNSIHNNLQVQISNQQILKITFPIALSILVPQINFITNNIFLGHIDGYGKEALAVAGITGVFYLIFAVIGNGLNSGLQSLIARRAGENKIDAIGSLFFQGVLVAMILAIAGMLITWFIAPSILRYSLHNEQHIQMSISFLNIRILGLPFLYLYQMRNALLVGTNQSKFLIYGTAAETISNVVLDYGFIYGKLGLPNLGFNGAAVASVIAEFIGLVVIFLVIKWKGISQQLQLFKNWKYDATNAKLILKTSAPLIVQFAISIISWEFFYILIEHHGSTNLAVSNAMRNIFGFFGCFTWAFASTSNAMVSNIIGQGLQHRVIELVYKISKLSVAFAMSVCLVINLFPNLFLSIYGQGPEFIAAAIPVLRVVSFALIVMSISVVWLNAVTGTGNTKINLYIEMMAIVLYCVYVYIVLEKLHLSIMWGWASEWLYWTSMLIPSFVYMNSNRWKNKRI